MLKLKKEASQAWLALGFAEAVDRYCLARRAAGSAVKEAESGGRGGRGDGL